MCALGALDAEPLLAARGGKVTCLPGRFLVQSEASTAPVLGAIVLTEAAVGLDGLCPDVEATQRPRRGGPRLRAEWAAGVCTALEGKTRLRAKFDPSCDTLRGKIEAKRYRRKVRATRSRCGDGIRDVGESCPSLEGPSEGLLIEATTFYGEGRFPLESEIEADTNGVQVVRTQVEVGILPTATVAEAGALFAGIGADIASMLQGVAIVGLRIPDPGSLVALDQILEGLRGDPLVRWAHRAVLPTPSVLPDPFDPPSVLDDPLGNLSYFDHHVAVRAHAAWNARRVAPRPALPTIVVADFFGGGQTTGAAFDVVDVNSDYGSGSPSFHGYHVLGVIAARFDRAAASAGAEVATGMYPGQVVLRVVDGKPRNVNQDDILRAVAAAPLPGAIVNTSLGFPCDNASLAQSFCTEAFAVQEARIWIEKVRNTGLEDRFLHVSAAGNVFYPLDTVAAWNSEPNAASLLPESLLGHPPLTNTLAVENVTQSPLQPFRPHCLYAGSKVGGNIAAIGTDVWSTDAADGGGGRDATGTSFAAPQVAGLAAYVWSLAPALTPQGVISLLGATSRQAAGTMCSGAAGEPAPVIDAYDALVATDATTLGAASTPVRHALLDVDMDGAGDGDFDDDDIRLFLAGPYFTGYLSGQQPGTAVSPLNPDYGRYDLNGDGYTGGPRTARFDLDRTGSTRYGASVYGTVTQLIENAPRDFDENALTDLDILCYYAYSPLFGDTANRQRRRDLLDPLCQPCPAAPALPVRRGADQCPIGPTGQIQIIARSSIAGAQARVGDSVSGEFVEDSPPPQSSFDLVAPFSGAVAADAVLTMAGGSASGSGNVNVVLTFDAMSRFTGTSGGGAASASCDAEELQGQYCGLTSGTGSHSITFDVIDDPVPYSITASVTGAGDGVGLVRLSPAGSGGDVFNFNSQGGSGGSQSGMLSPGRYTFNSSSVALPGVSGSASSGMSFTLSFGPLT